MAVIANTIEHYGMRCNAREPCKPQHTQNGYDRTHFGYVIMAFMLYIFYAII